MLGIIVQLLISWIIIWLFERKNLSVLGLYPTKQRLSDFVLYFLVTAACCSSGFLLRIYFGKEQWALNTSIDQATILKALGWHIRSVLFEELIFRGVILYILIKKLGAGKAIFISGIAFGIYHWFSQQVIGDIQQMVMTFLITGIMGLVYAYGYAKSYSLYIPSAMHLGWNLTQGFIFSKGAIGNGLFIQVYQPLVSVSFFIYALVAFFPIMSAWIVNFVLVKKRLQSIG